MSKLVVLDESRSEKHPIISVGGFVAELTDILRIERSWHEAKAKLGLDPFAPVKYSMSWQDRSHRTALIAFIGSLPVAGIVALLEDFRPPSYKLSKETRRDLFIHQPAFEYVLQRLVEPTYCTKGTGPHLVIFDRSDEFPRLARHYAELHPNPWRFPNRAVPSLASFGYSCSLTAAESGPLVEIADLLVSCLTRWAGVRCAIIKGKTVPERAELDTDVAALVSRFPTFGSSIPPRRRGYSVIVHKERRTGKELLAHHVDGWLNELATR